MTYITDNNGKKQLLYEQTIEKIREEIRLRKLKPHDPVPSEGEFAGLFGVSRMTTKLALEALAKQGLVYRLARRGTFIAENYETSQAERDNGNSPVQEAQHLKMKRIAIVVPNLDDYLSRIIISVESEVRKLGCHLLIKITKDKDDESSCLQELYDDQVDGVILFPRGRKTCSEKILRLTLLNYPLVIIDRIFREVQIDCVYHDHYQGAYRLAEYLITKGHNKIGYLSMSFDGVTSREDRYKGYMQALLNYHIPINSHCMLLNCSEDYMDNLTVSNQELISFFEQNPELTAVMCADDYLAVSCMYTALNMKMSIPEKLSIVGFSDIQLASLLPVPLTTVRQQTKRFGQAAVQLLVKRMNNNKEVATAIKVDTALVERSSVHFLQAIEQSKS
ncbi:DNA-binding transcriptional regulator, LacI/PurR family [Paenibacillus sp. 1_12]|uniref:GntR family transcriptional regulator n=1 Tax=Paenibacillus sp. 1_12 TaxID=1566278 RepID=UPI0008E9E558|nr:GntR family transcriptional regulator [Paenibacillus sp. 1_12]SFL11537.1 DNA-binding transcriptional regulator, LacI/PurR family [Paenibacillus sp. 1_12]